MIVRPATPPDAERVERILLGAPVPREVTAEQLREQFADPVSADGPGQWIVEEAGEAMGWLSLEWPEDREDVDALEISAYLDERFTGSGRGPKLLEEFLVPAAAEAGVTMLTATPTTAAAVSFVSRTGFARRASEPLLPDDPVARKLQESLPVDADAEQGVRAPWDRACNRLPG